MNYKKMSDKRLLRYYRFIKTSTKDEKLLLLAELLERELISNEEIQRHLETIKHEKNTKKKYPSAQRIYLGKGLVMLLFLGLHLLNGAILDFILGVRTLSWNETKAEIIEIKKGKRITKKNHEEKSFIFYRLKYQYEVDGVEYINNRMRANKIDDASSHTKLGKKSNEGDSIEIIYNPKNHSEALVYKYSFKELWFAFIGLILIFLFCLAAKKEAKDNGDKFNKKSLIPVFIIVETMILVLIILLELNS